MSYTPTGDIRGSTSEARLMMQPKAKIVIALYDEIPTGRLGIDVEEVLKGHKAEHYEVRVTDYGKVETSTRIIKSEPLRNVEHERA